MTLVQNGNFNPSVLKPEIAIAYHNRDVRFFADYFREKSVSSAIAEKHGGHEVYNQSVRGAAVRILEVFERVNA